jgi:hypothetical protein
MPLYYILDILIPFEALTSILEAQIVPQDVARFLLLFNTRWFVDNHRAGRHICSQ